MQTQTINLPQFGMADEWPELPIAEYQQRLAATVARMREEGLDFLVVYGDREHFANLAYLTGFDPRFEEALLVLDRDGGKTLLVGNECLGYLPDERLELNVVLFQEFSLLGQPRDKSRPIRDELAACGIKAGVTVGCAGWKYFSEALVAEPDFAIEIPAYLVDALRALTGERWRVRNATGIFMHPMWGLRLINSVDQLAQFEFAATRTSESVLAALLHLREGVAERDLERWFNGGGLPLSCHRMINFGEKVKRGLSSPAGNRAVVGGMYQIAIGLYGSLTARSSAIAHDAHDLPAELREFFPRFIANYFDVVATWYRSVRVGATGGDVFAAVEKRRDPSLYEFALNPGHYIHLDEWLHSPFSLDNPAPLRSGMALQVDIIPVSNGPFCSANAEDGVALADAALRAEFAQRYPACWSRIQERRRFMTNELNIPLDDSVLPLGNIPGWLPPYGLSPEVVLVAEE